MRPTVLLRLPDSSLAELEHGDLVGRVYCAALFLDDPRISEAHAFISLREGSFYLLSLRRMLEVDGRAVSEARLVPGVSVGLADGLSVTVEEVSVPAEVWTLETPGLPPIILPSVCSLRTRPRTAITRRFEDDAPAVVWWSGDAWHLRFGGEMRPLHAGDRFIVDGVPFHVRLQAQADAGGKTTLLQGGIHSPLRLVASFDTVQIHREGEPPLVFGGVPARILSELVAFGGPAGWSVLAREIWPDEAEEVALRKRWDVALARLRARLRDARVRPNLIQADGKGSFELVLVDGDTIEDRT